MNAIAKTEPMTLTYDAMERLAANIAKSGLFGIKTPDQAMVLMMIAHAEGRHPVLAARDYDVIQGRPAKKAEAMARDFLEAGGKIEWTTLSDDIADATFSHPRGGTVRIVWDIDRATLAGLHTKENWKKYPRQMLRSRVVSEGVRTIWPTATSGLYESTEVADGQPFTGPTLDQAEATTPRPVFVDRTATPEPQREAAIQQWSPPMPTGNAKTLHSIAPRPGAPDEAWRTCLDKVAPALARLRTAALVDEMAAAPTCCDIMGNGPEWARVELSQLLADNVRRFRDAEAAFGELPEIAGEAKVGAG